jgi:hypothetical protein
MKCLFEMLAMDDDIISISFIGTFGISFLKPCIKGKMQKYVCQQWRYYTPLLGAFALSGFNASVPLLYRCVEPTFHIHQNMFRCSDPLDSPDEHLVVNVVEDTFDIKVDCPIVLLAICLSLRHRHMLALSGSIPKRVGTKMWFCHFLKFLTNDLLCYPV